MISPLYEQLSQAATLYHRFRRRSNPPGLNLHISWRGPHFPSMGFQENHSLADCLLNSQAPLQRSPLSILMMVSWTTSSRMTSSMITLSISCRHTSPHASSVSPGHCLSLLRILTWCWSAGAEVGGGHGGTGYTGYVAIV